VIRHPVIFSLKHVRGSPEEARFLKDAKVLTAIPGVGNLEQLKQVCPKNEYDFGFSMEFALQAEYPAYNVAFVRDRWVPEVAKFLEMDYEALA
jgi:Stress responsive A/B Barrel Domain